MTSPVIVSCTVSCWICGISRQLDDSFISLFKSFETSFFNWPAIIRISDIYKSFRLTYKMRNKGYAAVISGGVKGQKCKRM